MARTKQTARKSDSKGQIPLQSSSGHMLATFPNRRSPRFLDSDSDLERAANMFGVKPSGSRQKSPARGSPARGSKRPTTPSSSDSGASPCKSPGLSSQMRGILAHGRVAVRGVGRSIPVGTVNPQQRKPGQSGFVQRGASRSSPRLALPSFSTEEDDDDDDDDDDDEEEGGDMEEEEVDFPNQGAGQRQ